MEKYLARFTVLVGPKVRVNFIWGRRLQIDDADSCLSDFDNILRITSDVRYFYWNFSHTIESNCFRFNN